MTSPHRIAMTAGLALVFAGSATSTVAHLLTGQSFKPQAIAFQALECFIAGVIVWVGTYAGARMCAPWLRTPRLVRVLAVLYGILGVLLSLPIKTHAVVVEMPRGGFTASYYLFSTAFCIVTALVIALIPLLVVRTLARAFGDEVGRDA